MTASHCKGASRVSGFQRFGVMEVAGLMVGVLECECGISCHKISMFQGLSSM